MFTGRLPLGYVLHKSFLRDTDRSTNTNVHLIELLLPAQVKADLDRQAHDERIQKALAEAEQDRREEERLDSIRAAAQARHAAEAKAAEERLRVQTRLGQPAIEQNAALAEPDYDPKRSYPVYPVNAPNNLLSRSTLNTPDKDVRKRDDELYKKMAAQGNLREIAMPENVVAALDGLRLSQPHFGAVIDLIRGQLPDGRASRHLCTDPTHAA